MEHTREHKSQGRTYVEFRMSLNSSSDMTSIAALTWTHLIRIDFFAE